MTDRGMATVRQYLLALIGTAPAAACALSDRDWTRLDALAVQHRLQPLLHARHRGNPAIPPAVAAGWCAAYRQAALIALAQQRDLAGAISILTDAGLSPIALKGAWLVRHAYPHAAQRPLRDLDLLLDPETVLHGYAALQQAGYMRDDTDRRSLEHVLQVDKHLPPLRAPGGTRIELHHRLWELPGRVDHAMPAARDAEIRARAIRDSDGVCFPAADDMLTHLITHAAYSHRLDCGPLLLSDLALLVQHHPVNWAAFWQRATAEGWRAGARLVLELVRRHHPDVAIDLAVDQGQPIPPELIARAPLLLLPDLAVRGSAGLGAVVLRLRPGRLLTRWQAQRDMAAASPVAQHTASWAFTRGVRTLRELTHREVREQARALAQIGDWLDKSG